MTYQQRYPQNSLLCDRENQLLLTLLIAGSISMVVSGIWLLQSAWKIEFSWIAWVITIVGVFVFLFSLRVMDRSIQMRWLGLISTTASRLGLYGWQLVCLIMAFFLSVIATLAAGTDPSMHIPPLAVISWLGGIGMTLLGGWSFGNSWVKISRQTFLLIIVFFVVSMLIRGINTQHIPVVLSGDEASSGLNAVQFIQGSTNNVFRAGWFSFPAFFFFIQSIPIKLLGNTIPALRLLSALAGAVTVIVVYMVARAVFGAWAAFFSAVFLSAFHFHHHFSRIGLNNIWDGLWFVAVLGMLWAGWEREDRRYMIGAGLALGLSQYFYLTSRMLFPIIFLWTLIVGIGQKAKIKRLWPHFALMFFVCLVVIFPLAVYYISFPQEFLAPFRRVSVFGAWMEIEVQRTGLQPWNILIRQIGKSYLGFICTPIKTWYVTGTPLLRPFSAALFVIGLILLIYDIRKSGAVLLLIWLLSFGITGGLSESTPAAQRYVAAAPAIAIVIGYGVAEVTARLKLLWPTFEKYVYAGSILLVFFLAVDELRFYYLEYTPHGEFGGDNNLVAQRLANYLQPKDSSWKVYFFGYPRMGYQSFSTLPYLVPQIQGIDMLHAWNSPDNPPIVGDHIVFVFLPEHTQDLNQAIEEYPSGKLIQEFDQGDIVYWLYEVLLER